MSAAAPNDPSAPHIPVLLPSILRAVSPVEGTWIDGTFGAGGYTRGLLEAGAAKVIAIDRDPLAFELATDWMDRYSAQLVLQLGVFSAMTEYADQVDGVVLDLGVSSMQLDQAARGFSFMKEGPLDMRMSQQGVSAADLVNTASAETLADVLFHYGEERASRRIARAIVAARDVAPIATTLALAQIVEGCLPRAKQGQSHPATRTFQALRIAINDEYRELYQGLMAAEQVLKPGGKLAVVTFHSIEDRMVKRFLTARAGAGGNANRFAPQTEQPTPVFTLPTRKAISADADERDANPRSRSAKLRVALRTDAPAGEIDAKSLGMPMIELGT